MSKKIKVMHIINNLEVGGAEKILVLLAKELSKRDDLDIYVVSLEGHGPLAADLPSRVHYKQFNYHLFLGPVISRLDMNFRFGLYKYVKQIKPDIIHGHLFKGEDFAKLLGALTKTPVITTSHDSLVWPGRKTKLLNRYLVNAIAVSKSVADHLRVACEISENKIVIIPNAIETKLFEAGKKSFNKTKPVFIFIGRLLKSKGIDDAIIGLAKLRSDYPNLQLLIYGKEVFKSYKDSLDKLVAKNKYDFVKFMGRTDDVPSALRTGDIFILPSQSEGFAISVLEAAAASKPVIATKVGAIGDMVIEGKSGLFVDWHSPDQIYLAAKKILDENLVEKYGKVGREIARNSFDISKVEQMHYDLYKKVNNEANKIDLV